MATNKYQTTNIRSEDVDGDYKDPSVKTSTYTLDSGKKFKAPRSTYNSRWSAEELKKKPAPSEYKNKNGGFVKQLKPADYAGKADYDYIDFDDQKNRTRKVIDELNAGKYKVSKAKTNALKRKLV